MSSKSYQKDDVANSSSLTKNKFVMTRSKIISIIAAVGLVIAVAVHHHSSSPNTPTVQWPLVLYSSFLSGFNEYKGTGDLGVMISAPAPAVPWQPVGRPTTTKEAAANGWKPLQKECVPNLGYPWAFDGKITDGAPVTLYYSKETKQNDGLLTGMAVHYYDNAAPDTMIGSEFVKGDDYDTLQVAFYDKNTDMCGGGLLNKPSFAVLLVDGKGRKSIPMTEDAAKSSDWVKEACLNGMGLHYWTDIKHGSNLSFEAENLFPIAPMYNQKDGSLNGIMFVAAKPLQKWDIENCGYMYPNPKMGECVTKTNMWDGNPLGLFEKLDSKKYPGYPFGMCANFSDDTCQDRLTGAAGSPPAYTTMHWYFVKDVEDTTCGPHS
mmetsp:Transcript_8848/g.10123  ORF Transcript_8848/g.10123 Transcript_8848/m.10123 type:complete len:377 (+) Transcript_8848:55-1185(+)